MDAQNTKLRKRVFFLTNSEYGQANVILAVAYELLLRQNYEVHIGSFAPLQRRILELNELASSNSFGSVIPPVFHLIPGPSAQEALVAFSAKNEFIGPYPPGIRGAVDCYRVTLPAMATMWKGPEYMAGYASCLDIIQLLSPDIIVVDPLMSQGLDACKTLSRDCVVLSPNTFREIMPQQQPVLNKLCKYPAISSGFPYPVPWHLIPANIYLTISLIWTIITNPKLKDLKKYRESQNLPKLPPVFNIWQPENHYLVPSIPETDFPCYIAPNVTPCGPILLPEKPISESDPKLLAWLQRGPTVLINLGSHIRIDDGMAQEFAAAIKVLLESDPDVQVLWKLKTSGGLSILPRSKAEPGGLKTTVARTVTADSLKAIKTEVSDGRVRVEEWLSVDPVAVLQSGHVACSVHHGGSNSFHEALSAGVPQVILPCWLDTFDFANRVEYLGIGVYGSRSAAPRVKAEELSIALMRVMGNTKQAVRMKEKARMLAEITGKVGGRVKACEKIVEILEASG